MVTTRLIDPELTGMEKRMAEISGAMRRANILIVDDRPANLLALEAVLEPLGQTIVRANSGEEALKALLHKEFAVILMDVQMPGLDGIQTAALIQGRERTRHTPIIFLTAINKDPVHIFAGYAHGGVDYLVKPFDDEILRRKVTTFVNLYLKEAALRDRERLLLEEKSQQRLVALIDAIPQSVWAARPNGEVYYSNRWWLDYSGQTPEESSGAGYLSAVHPDDRDALKKHADTSVAARQAFELEFRARRAVDGEYRWHLIRGVPEIGPDSVLRGWIGTAIDIHAQKTIDQERAQVLEREQNARVAAERANRMKDEFLATVSHELRNPLQAILGWTRILMKGGLDDEKAKRGLATIERNAVAQSELIEDILDVSRIITGKLRLDIRPLSLKSVINAAIDTVRPTVEAKELTIDFEHEALADDAMGDEERLQQIVWNLLSNAVKFTPKGGKIMVASRRVESHLEVSVQDTGNGIAPEFLPHVFDRFRQADSSSTRSFGGLGLGLAIVRHLVELHGGEVRVESEGKGKGAKFTVALPLRAVAAGAREAPSAERRGRALLAFDAIPTLDGLRLLVVDDEVDARELVAAVLAEFGAHVDMAGSADEALSAVCKQRYDVLVSDIGMPKEDGFSLIRRLRALSPQECGDVPAIALTGFARIEDNKRSVDEGFQLHIAKPVDPAELVVQVARLAKRV